MSISNHCVLWDVFLIDVAVIPVSPNPAPTPSFSPPLLPPPTSTTAIDATRTGAISGAECNSKSNHIQSHQHRHLTSKHYSWHLFSLGLSLFLTLNLSHSQSQSHTHTFSQPLSLSILSALFCLSSPLASVGMRHFPQLPRPTQQEALVHSPQCLEPRYCSQTHSSHGGKGCRPQGGIKHISGPGTGGGGLEVGRGGDV